MEQHRSLPLTTRLSQVLRWGALALGVFYGFSHQSSIYSKEKALEAKHEYERKSKLISDAKVAFAAKNAPPGAGDGGEYQMRKRRLLCLSIYCLYPVSDPIETVITNFDDPRFDLEAFINKAVKETA